RRVRVLGAEGRAEGVDLAERAGENLGFELAANRQIGRTAEEVLAVVDLALVVARQLAEVERGDAEHLAGALAVAGGDDRRMDVEKTLFLKEFVDGSADTVADAGHGAEGVAARPQMGLLAQKLHRMPLLLQRIFRRIGPAVDGDRLRLDL